MRNKLYQFIYRLCLKNEIAILGTSILYLLIFLRTLFRFQTYPYRVRQFISLIQSSNPLKNQELPTVNVAIPCHIKDYKNLNLVIQGIQRNVINPIDKIQIFVPENQLNQFKQKFPNQIILSERKIINSELRNFIDTNIPEIRKGWITQQLVKILIGLQSDKVATLIVDSDTVLLKPRIWLDSQGKQSISMSCEYHSAYKVQQFNFFKSRSSAFSFVTHHQLMKKDSLQRIYGAKGENLISWLTCADFNNDSALSEYDTYGEWMLRNEIRSLVFSKWNNLSAAFNLDLFTDLEELSNQFPQFHSISNHSYLEK